MPRSAMKSYPTPWDAVGMPWSAMGGTMATPQHATKNEPLTSHICVFYGFRAGFYGQHQTPELFASHHPTRGSGQRVSIKCHGSDWVGSPSVQTITGQVGSVKHFLISRAGSGRIKTCKSHRSSRFRSRMSYISRVGSAQVKG